MKKTEESEEISDLVFSQEEILDALLEEEHSDPEVRCYEWWQFYDLAHSLLSKPRPPEVIPPPY